MGLQALSLVAPFVLAILAVSLLLYCIGHNKSLNRGKQDQTAIINKIPSKMPPLPKDSRKPYSPIFNSLTTSHDSLNPR
jgi:hypothetical protein